MLDSGLLSGDGVKSSCMDAIFATVFKYEFVPNISTTRDSDSLTKFLMKYFTEEYTSRDSATQTGFSITLKTA